MISVNGFLVAISTALSSGGGREGERGGPIVYCC